MGTTPIHPGALAYGEETGLEASHMHLVPGLCALVFPRPLRVPGPWEWVVSASLATFYLVRGRSLMRRVVAELPAAAQAVFDPALVLVAGLSLPLRAHDGSRQRRWMFAALVSGFSPSLLAFFDGIVIQRPGQHLRRHFQAVSAWRPGTPGPQSAGVSAGQAPRPGRKTRTPPARGLR